MQKFIITHEGVFKHGNVRMHKDLLDAKDLCIGGGFYEFDYVSNRLLLSGKSYDFGKPKWNYIDVLKVPSAFRGLTILYEGEDVSHRKIKKFFVKNCTCFLHFLFLPTRTIMNNLK